jgi:hypothetical protein
MAVYPPRHFLSRYEIRFSASFSMVPRIPDGRPCYLGDCRHVIMCAVHASGSKRADAPCCCRPDCQRNECAKCILDGEGAVKAESLAAFLLFALAGCVYYDHSAASVAGNSEHDRIISIGGTSSQKGADGSSFTHDHQKSLSDAMQGAAGIAGAVYLGKTNLAHENGITATNLASQKTAQQANAALIPLSKPIVTNPGQTVTTPSLLAPIQR